MHLRNSNVMDHFETRNSRLSSDNLISTVHSPTIDLTTRQSNHLIKQENSVHIPWRTLIEFGQNNLVRFALIIYKQIDQFIQPNYELFSNSIVVPTTISSNQQQQPQQQSTKLQINSDLVGLLLTNEPFLQIPGTVFITFKHRQNSTSNQSAQLHPQTQYCALWNYSLKQWQTDGCQLIESNRTHSTCECNHLSVYALLKSTSFEDQEQQKRDSLNHLTNERTLDQANLDNILIIAGYNWSFYTNQLKALVASSCYLTILCLSFVLISLSFIQYRQSKTIKLLNKKASINGTLTDLSLNIHYGTYHSSTASNSLTYDTSAAAASKSIQTKQTTFCTHLNLCFVLMLIELLLVFSSKTLPTRLDYENRLNCAIFAALLHYLLLSLFVWLLFDVLILHSNIKFHLNQFNLLKSTGYSLPTISSSNLTTNIQQRNLISNKWLIAIAYGSCSLLLLISVLIDAQSYGAALLSSGHCFLTNSGSSYLYLLVLPIFILIVIITAISFSSIKQMAKTRYSLAFQNSVNAKSTADNSGTFMNNGQYFTANALLCKQLKESIVTVIIVSLTWSAGLVYLNTAEKLPTISITSSNQIGSRSYQLFGILFSALNIAQAAFFVLYYCLLDSIVRKTYQQFFSRLRRSCLMCFNGLLAKFRRNDKVASSLNANTPSLLVNANSNHQIKANDLIGKPIISGDQLINQQPNQPIIPPPINVNQNTMKNFYLNTQSMNNSVNAGLSSAKIANSLDEPEKCSIDYGFPPVSLINNNVNRNFHTTTPYQQFANSTQGNAYVSKNVITQYNPQQQIVEHVYESIDGENPYIAKLLSNYQMLNSNHHIHHQLNHLHKTLRPISSIVQQQQFSNIYQQQINSLNSSHGHLRSLSDLSNISERPLLNSQQNKNHHLNAMPAIIRDNTKSSTILPNFGQQHHKIKRFLNNDHFNITQQQQQQLSAQQLLKESTLI